MFDRLTDKLAAAFKKLKGHGKLSEAQVGEGLREVRLALLEADVNYKVTKGFIDRVKERAIGEEVMRSLTPAQQVVKIVHEELTGLLGGESPKLDLGGRPPIAHQCILKVLWFVLATGCRWEDVPPELGCSGRTAHRFLQRWEEMGCWDRLHADLLRLLRQAGKLDPDLVIIDAVLVRAFGGGDLTGPSPVDRRKKGSKHTLMVDRHGVPLAIRTAGANASDHRQIIPLVRDFPKVTGKPGRPKELPDEAYADRAESWEHSAASSPGGSRAAAG